MSGFVRRFGLPISLALLMAAVWADPLWTGRNFAGRDLEAHDLPAEKVIHDAYARGTWPLWVSEISGGRPFLPNPNGGALYPMRPLLSLLPLPWMVRLYPILHWALGGIGVALLLGSLGVGRAGQWMGAVTYAFSGVFVSEIFLDQPLAGTALLPWILWALGRIERPVSTRTALLGFLFGLDLLAGEVFTIALAAMGAVLWIVLESSARQRARLSVALALALAMAVFLAAPQIVATALWIPHTARAAIGMRLGEALAFSISPWRLLEFLAPYPFGATSSLEYARVWGGSIFGTRPAGLHVTLYAGAFAALAVPLTWSERRPGVRFAKVLLVASLLLCVVPSFIPRSWGDWKFPLALRNPEKFAVGAAFGLAILAGFALERLRARPISARVPVWISAIMAAGAAAAAAAPRPAASLACGLVGRPCPPATAAHELPLSLAEGGVFWLLTAAAVVLFPRRRHLGAAALILLSLVPIAANRRIAQLARDDELFAPTAFARRVAKQDPSGRYRVLGESLYRARSVLDLEVTESEPTYTAGPRRHWLDHTSVLWDRGTVFNIDFDRGDLTRLERLRQIAAVASRSPHPGVFFGALANRWGIRFRDQQPLPGYQRFGGDSLQDWDELDTAFPDIRLLTGWREVAAPLEALNRFSQLQPGEVTVESGRQVHGAARPGSVRILEESPNRLSLDVETPDPTWLFVLRGFWPYRRVLLDGAPARVSPAQIAFSALAIPSGSHRVTWQETLPGAPLSLMGPPLFVLAAVAMGYVGRRYRLDGMPAS